MYILTTSAVGTSSPTWGGGDLEQSLSFDAWGNRRNAATWSGPANDDPLFDRGFTGHEHLYNFGLINMNGRIYDPYMSTFLSPDNYIQAPDNSQNFNRYAYCLNNPLKYIDPSGERYFGYNEAMAYQMLEAMQKQIFHEWFSVYDIAMATHDLLMQMTTTLFSKGNSTGNEGCGTGGGFSQEYIKKCNELGITPGMPIPKEKQTDEFLKRFQEVFFPDAPMEYVICFVVEGLDNKAEFLRGTTINEGKTKPEWVDGMFSGYSSVYFNGDIVFKDPEELFYTIGHELVHVGQIIELAGDPRQNWCDGLTYIMDVYAYSWMHDMGRSKPWGRNREYEMNWGSYCNCLTYINFSWLNNITRPYKP